MEKELFESLDIQPIMLSKCSYENLSRHKIEEGSDVCIHMDTENFKCEECEYTKDRFPFYPELDDSLYLWIGAYVLSNITTREYDGYIDFKRDILKRAIEIINTNLTIKTLIREAIINYYKYDYPTLK